MRREALVGCLIGTAVGDSLGLPYEGLSARRARRLFPDVGRHHLIGGRGMVSDDTEHACFVAQALIRSGGDVDVFRASLARSLRLWLAGLPAGVGLATARAILKLWIGVSPHRSGVFSAGNGPSMRAPLIGVSLGSDPERLTAFVRASTELTHTDPKAYVAALAVALAAHQSAAGDAIDPTEYRRVLASLLRGVEAAPFFDRVEQAAESAARNEPVATFAAAIGSPRGISGYSYHTVPCVLQAWFRHADDFALGLEDVLRAGGDTDTAGAIFGGIAGARAGRTRIPEPWIEGIAEWPRSIRWIEALGAATPTSADEPPVDPASPPGYAWPALPARNLVFLAVVLAHGLRRLAPPY